MCALPIQSVNILDKIFVCLKQVSKELQILKFVVVENHFGHILGGAKHLADCISCDFSLYVLFLFLRQNKIN